MQPTSRGPFLETPDNFPGPKTILGAQYSKAKMIPIFSNSYTIFIDLEN